MLTRKNEKTISTFLLILSDISFNKAQECVKIIEKLKNSIREKGYFTAYELFECFGIGTVDTDKNIICKSCDSLNYTGYYDSEWGNTPTKWFISGIEKLEFEFLNDNMNTDNKKEDIVNHPSHYTAGGIECIDAIAAALTCHTDPHAAWLTGNIIKYLWRWPLKNGLEDLKKAQFYLNRLIERIEKGSK